ncbi:putative alpha beta hydrolase fold protein [Rosellinia necatrix]|uniref:Putative alpha beta hydrolase fold protein n=1 Tax=Rosellinia necatrix TaxID=77044 RepID=A0A1S8A5R3_ROSNE|nr:putative alpha beta hydrolase fold protein [Rosellinia necatrix]
MYLTEEWLAYERQLGGRPMITGTWQEIRAAYSGLCDVIAKKLPPQDPSLVVQDIKVSDQLSVRTYTPRQAVPGEKLPLGVYAHGGGLVTGSVDASFEDYNCRYIAQNTPCILVSVDFRLAPEYLAPTQVDDVLQGFLWAYENCDRLGGDVSKCFLIGASVGGGLAMGAAFHLIERGMGSSFVGIVALAPITMHPEYVPDEFKKDFVAYTENAEGPLINRAAMYNFNAQNGCDQMKDDPYVFPALHAAKSKLPPMYISTCGADPLRDDGTVIYLALQKHGIKSTLKNYPGLPHFFWIFPEITEGDTFRADTVGGIRFILGEN